ncbi:PREDICTED: keratin, type II cytoskeletal 8-like [Cyprinodon variegatus]|uniref:Keratin, type II cytoskeletal 8-like n=1 Tax=Cyprinodon variegatus TaxID=28743 RepID=A0A3Q2E3D5_CYPVA|nr:PREDICTED: keratin, type II cytoskeletal 8-like [Cyprinodon variegatus]
MSLRIKQNKRTGRFSSSGGFSSMSTGSYPMLKASTTNNVVSIKPVTINKSLLDPVKMDIDPAIHTLRTQEKDQIKGLNNRFASYIQQVQLLEQQNKMLETKWQLLQKQTATSTDTDAMFKSNIANLQKQLDLILNQRHLMEMEKNALIDQTKSYQSKYEEEISKRGDAENLFVMTKRDVDAAYMNKTELENKVSALYDELNFLRAVHEAELRELQGSVKETSVVVEMDNSRDLNMDQIISEVKAQYEEVAARSREEAENWYKTKFDVMAAEANQYDAELISTKGEIAELQRMISRLKNEIDVVTAQRATIELKISEVEERGQETVADAKDRIRELEQALTDAKHAMAKQIRNYQELMNTKLALDIEISTYRKLVEGEEDRIGQKTVFNVRSAPIKTVNPAPSKPNLERRKSGAILIKTVTTKDISYTE